MRKLLSLLTAACLTTVISTSCKASEWQSSEAEFFAMDTVMSVKVYGPNGKTAVGRAEDTINEMDHIFSAQRENSETYLLNTKKQAELNTLSQNMQELLEISSAVSKQTNGAFDITLGGLSRLWGFGTDKQQVPTREQIDKVLEQCGYQNLELGTETVKLNNGIQLDFGAIAKGYATDQAAEQIRKCEEDNALLYLGGNILAMGTNQGKPWKIGIANPEDSAAILGYLSLTDKAIVTSGDYQRYFEQDGKRYHHIMDSQTGMPADNELSSVTIINDSATYADAYSTALYVMGLQQGKAFADANGIEAVFVTKDRQVICTNGIRDAFTLSKDTDYILVS